MAFILRKPSCQLYQWAVKLVSTEYVVLLMLNQCPVCDATINLTETETHSANQIIINYCDQHHAASNFMVSVCVWVIFFFRLDSNNKNNNIHLMYGPEGNS